MPRINIEDQLFNDGRFQNLAIKHGDLVAIGLMVKAYKMAQTYWLKDGSKIPKDEFLFNPIFEDIIKVGLAEVTTEGVYVKGSKEQFDWIKQRVSASKKGGEANKKRWELVKNRAETEPKHSRNIAEIELNDSPQSQSQSQSQSINNIASGKKRKTELTPDDIDQLEDFFQEGLLDLKKKEFDQEYVEKEIGSLKAHLHNKILKQKVSVRGLTAQLNTWLHSFNKWEKHQKAKTENPLSEDDWDNLAEIVFSGGSI